MAATPSSPAARAIALLIPEAIPACSSSASASTVAVSGATVAERPSREQEQRRQQLGQVVGVRADAQHQQLPGRGHQRPAAHERPRPVAVGERARALGEHEHHQRGRQRREPGLQRGVARDLLQEQDEVEEHHRQPGVHRERLDVARREVAPLEQLQRQHRVRGRGLAREEQLRRRRGRRGRARTRPARSSRSRAGGSARASARRGRGTTAPRRASRPAAGRRPARAAAPR